MLNKKRSLMEIKIKKILFTEEMIQKAIVKAADKINKEYKGKNLTLVCLLKGSANFTMDLSKRLKINHRIGYILAKSYYGGTKSTEKTNILSDIDFSVEGHDLIVVEDIIDSGRTLNTITNHLKTKNPNSIKIFTLLDKEVKRVKDIKIDYSCFKVKDVFLIGYGLDYDEMYRNIPYIGEAEIIESKDKN
jgi:hypoxanthine phosphoribosyltransferase